MLNDNDLIDKTAKFVEIKLRHEPSGHDWFHIERVRKMAKNLQSQEGGDQLVIELGALLHNLNEANYPLYLEDKPTLALHGMMDVLEIEEPLRSQVIHIIDDSKFNAIDTRRPINIEGKILQDANWLDSLGAIGIARAFSSGGFMRRALHDPGIPPRINMDRITYQNTKIESTSYNYIFEKSLALVDLLNTKTAKRIAKNRITYTNNFITQFNKEWTLEDVFGES